MADAGTTDWAAARSLFARIAGWDGISDLMASHVERISATLDAGARAEAEHARLTIRVAELEEERATLIAQRDYLAAGILWPILDATGYQMGDTAGDIAARVRAAIDDVAKGVAALDDWPRDDEEESTR